MLLQRELDEETAAMAGALREAGYGYGMQVHCAETSLEEEKHGSVDDADAEKAATATVPVAAEDSRAPNRLELGDAAVDNDEDEDEDDERFWLAGFVGDTVCTARTKSLKLLATWPFIGECSGQRCRSTSLLLPK